MMSNKIFEVVGFLIHQKSISANTDGGDFAGFYIESVPSVLDEPNYHIAKSILKKLDNSGYIKYTSPSNINGLNGFCVVEFLPKYKRLKLKFYIHQVVSTVYVNLKLFFKLVVCYIFTYSKP